MIEFIWKPGKTNEIKSISGAGNARHDLYHA